MIDLHSHIMPFVDDGSDGLETSYEMLRMAIAASTEKIVLTPHSNLYENDRNLLFELEFVFEAFKKKVEMQNIPIEIYLGGEVFANDSIIEYARQHVLPTINNSRFMLIEFDFSSSIQYIKRVVSQISDMGYVPIVAHPERYECIKRQPSHSMSIMNCGGLLQINKGSITGEFGPEARYTAYELINHKTAQFVASDAHSIDFRNTDMETAYSMVENEFGENMAKRLFEKNAQAVLDNGRLAIGRPIAF